MLASVPEPVRLEESVATGTIPRRIEVREHAQSLGIDISYEIVQSNDDGKRINSIQTLYYPADPEKQAKRIASDARTVIEETGSNMLYMVFGFLEFYDSDASDKPLLAPLIAMPIELVRGKVSKPRSIFKKQC